MTEDPRVLLVECSHGNVSTAAICLMYILDNEVLEQGVFMLDVKGPSVRTFGIIFEKMARRAGFDAKELARKLPIHAENGLIVANHGFDSDLFAIGKEIPG